MRLILDTFPHPLKVVIAVLLAAVLCGWFAADPWAALRFWPGVLMGALGAIVGRQRLKAMSVRRAGRLFKIFSCPVGLVCVGVRASTGHSSDRCAIWNLAGVDGGDGNRAAQMAAFTFNAIASSPNVRSQTESIGPSR